MKRKLIAISLLSAMVLLGGCSFGKKAEVSGQTAPKTETAAPTDKSTEPDGNRPVETKPTNGTAPKQEGQAAIGSEKPGLPSLPDGAAKKPLPPESVTQMELILDASGSMWGQVEGKAKIDIAKEAMGKIIDDLKGREKLEVALRIYAHQNKECTNSVVEFPMGKIDADAMKTMVKGIKPLGSTPIAYSLSESVKDFKKGIPGDKVVVLVTDGLESCGGDPCAAAKALREGGVVGKIHVVGFGLSEAELQTLKCIAEPSGGLLVGASNATEFTGAMEQIMDKSLDKNLDLRGLNLKKEGVFMSVKAMQEGKVIAEGQGTQVLLSVPAGKYDIQADAFDGSDSVNVKGVEVAADKLTKKEFVFVQGNFGVKVVGADGKPLKASDICVYPQGETEKERGCAGFYASEFRFTLKPGTYDLRVENSGTSAEAWVKDIELREGEVVEKTVSFGEGGLKVNVIGADGNELQSNNLCVYEEGRPEKELACAGFYTSEFEFKLKPGTYDVKVVNSGTSEERWLKGIVVKASETVNREISFEEGIIDVNVIGADGADLQVSDICVYAQGETDKELACAGFFTSEFEFKLVPGTYDVKVTNYEATEEKWSKGISIKAAQTVQKTIRY